MPKARFTFNGTMPIAAMIALFSAPSFSIDPAPVNMGPVDFIPTLDLDIKSDDNIYSSNDNEISSEIFVIRPELLFLAQDNLNTYKASIALESGTYNDGGEGDDDYLDGKLHLDGHWEFNDKNRLDALLHLNRLHDARGDAFTAGGTSNFPPSAIISEVDVYSSNDLGLKYELGIGNTNTGITAAYMLHDRKYDDNKALDGTKRDNSNRNYESGLLDLSFFYQLLPKTKIFFEVSHEDIDYDNDINASVSGILVESLDSTETYYYLGAQWELTANTTGTVKIGGYDKNFDDSAIEAADGNFGEAAWALAIDWSPLEHAQFHFDSGSYVDENQGGATARAIQDFSAAWRQAWLEHFSTIAEIKVTKSEHKGSEIILGKLREDTDTQFKIGAIYNFRRWMDFELDYITKSRSSTLNGSFTNSSGFTPNFEYDSNVIQISAQISL